MSLPKFADVKLLSNNEISKSIVETEAQLFNLRFKKATRQSFKSHEITHVKRRLAQLKTILTAKLNNTDSQDNN